MEPRGVDFSQPPQPQEVEVVRPEPTPKEPVRELTQRCAVVGRLLDNTWQRRIIIENLISASDPSQYVTSMRAASSARLFTTSDLQNGRIVEGSSLQRLISDSKTPQADKVALIEKYLLDRAREDYPQIHQVDASSLPVQIFARPRDRYSLAKAAQFTTSERGNAPVDDFLASDGPEQIGYRPFLETVLAAEFNRLVGKIGVEVLSGKQVADEFWKDWLREVKTSLDRTVFSPTYREFARDCHAYMRRNGKNRTIARSVAYGPPGQGKTEVLRALNRLDGKSTMVISGRPHLGYEELVASVKLVDKDDASKFAVLEREYLRLEPQQVAANLVLVSKKIASQQAESIDFAANASREETIKTLQLQWLTDMAGIPAEQAEVLCNVQVLKGGKIQLPQDLGQTFLKDVQAAFTGHLLERATLSTFDVNESTKYLRGVILTADKLGMRVVIDEAEKMYKGTPEESPSFGGLEDLLTRQPGSSIRIGDIEHRFSDDFCIDLTMNEPSIPLHVKSRFGERTFYLDANAYDRMAIAAVGTANSEGEFGISPQAQEELIFFATFAWPAVARAAHLKGEPFDLRLFQNIISGLIHEGRSTSKTLSEILSNIPHEEIRKTIDRFECFRSQIQMPDLSLLDGQAEIGSEEATSPFFEALENGPEGVEPTNSLNTTNLTEEDIDKLSRRNAETIPNSAEQIDAIPARITLGAADSPNPNLLFTSKVGDGNLYKGEVRFVYSEGQPGKPAPSAILTPTPESPLELDSASAFGTAVLAKQGTSYVVLDPNGAISGELQKNIVRPVSPVIASPTEIKLSPRGDYIYYIKDGKLSFQPLALYNSKDGISPAEAFIVEISDEGSPVSVNITKDGNFALVKCDNNRSYLVDLLATQKTGSPNVRYQCAGEGWDVESFQNVVYIFNPDTKQGFCVS